MTLRFASPIHVLASFVLILMAPSATFAQAPDSTAAAAQQPGQQPSLERPQVFFPMADQPQMEMHHHGQIQEVMPHFPRLGDSQHVVTGPIYELEELERMAITSNPTLVQAQRGIEAARGRERQAGLYPNPVVGYSSDEIRGGSYGGGEEGFFAEQIGHSWRQTQPESQGGRC